jgi:hypothetical protein
MECVRLSCVLQVGTIDRWVWKLHVSQCYTLKSAYYYLTAIDTNLNDGFDSFLWLKAVLLKVNIFIWRLFLNRLPTKENLLRRGVIEATQLPCVALCGESEDINHLFFRCDVYGRLWNLVSKWLGFVSVLHGNTLNHDHQFRGLGCFSKNSRNTFTVIWILGTFFYMERSQQKDFPQQFGPARDTCKKG